MGFSHYRIICYVMSFGIILHTILLKKGWVALKPEYVSDFVAFCHSEGYFVVSDKNIIYL